MGIVNYTYNRSTSGGEIITHLINSTDGEGLHFDGAAGEVEFTPPDLGTKFSMEFIVQADADFAGTNTYLIDFGTGGRFALGNITEASGFSIRDNTSYGSFGVGIWDDLKVHHIVVTVDGTSAIAYDNGNEVGTTSIATPTLDFCSAAFIGANYVGSGSFFNGIIYRCRFWNKTLSQAEVTASYENATVPFADQYGSQAVLIGVATGLDGWDAANTWNSQTTAGSNMILSASASGQYCRTNTTLGVGKKYRLIYTATNVYAGSYFGGFWGGGYTNIHQIVAGTNTVEFTFEFSAAFVNDYFYCHSGDSTSTVTLSNLSLVEIGCVADYDLAFANPTQSLMVQDRAGAADGTSSATGVVQVAKLEQVNTNKIAVGGVTPLVGIGLAAGTTPLGLLHLEKTGGADIIMHQTAADTTGYLGAIQFGNKNDDAYLATVAGIQDGHVGSGKLEFQTQADGSAKATRLTIASTGAVAVGGTPSAISYGLLQLQGVEADRGIFINSGTDEDHTLLNLTGLSGGGKLEWINSTQSFNFTKLATFANGIAFTQTGTAATGAATTSSTLDHYEEGTWTAVLKEGTTAITLAHDLMVYVRVGKMVTISGYIAINDASIGSGALTIEGLPFAMDNSIDASENWANFNIQDQYDDGFNTGGVPVMAYSNYGQSKIMLIKNAYAGAGRVLLYGSEIQDSGQIRVSGTYIAA